MDLNPIVGLIEIHRRYFVSKDGQEIISLKSLEKMSVEMQVAGAVARMTIMINGKKKVRIVAIEPFFSLWRREKLCGKLKKNKIEGFMGEVLKG